ncbi:MAG TPA: HU family DNA-binding protein [Blastocatellia bacterium]|jgi:nucleoid DNA-binding protein|nr:HU family DNA-binding protein [Blastocatellia bacterium]
MKKSDLIDEAMRRTGLNRRDATRGVEAALEAIKRVLGNNETVSIRGLGRMYLGPKRSGFLPANADCSRRPIPAGKAVRLRATRKAVASMNTEPLKLENFEINCGGEMDKKHENQAAGNEAVVNEGSALGLDVGTSRLVLASGHAGHVKTSAELNAFITVPYSKFTENILKQNKVSYQLNGGQALQIYGNEAERFANTFNAETRRPMMGGTLNASEEYSIPVMQAIIKQMLRTTKKGESLRFSVPGAMRDGGASDLVYHEAMLKNLLGQMGYNAKGINEGLAVVFAELEKENFSGIGISCGGGMCNVALAFMSIPVMTFSIGKAGDYVDRSVASVTGEVPTRIRVIKEEGLDLSHSPKSKYESALHVYYDDVIVSLVESLRGALAETRNMPRIDKPIPIVLSGGTAKPKGFLERFQQAIERDGFPLQISEIRMAADPLTATARGCLIAAMYDA